MTTSEFWMVFGGFWFLLGLVCIITFIKEKIKPYEIVNGTVIGYKESFSRTGISYSPVYEYSYDGIVYQNEHRMGGAKYGDGMKIEPDCAYKPGDEVSLRVYLDSPEKAIVNDEENIEMPIIAGILSCIIGAIFVFLSFNI